LHVDLHVHLHVHVDVDVDEKPQSADPSLRLVRASVIG
jgi:hypothetical protein